MESIYILAHEYKHFSHNGAGLRSLLDIYVYLQTHTALDFDYIGRELKKLKLSDYERLTRELAVKLFSFQQLNDDETQLLSQFLYSSLYGSQEQGEYNMLTRELDGKDSVTVKAKYIFERIFLYGDSLKTHYPFFAKHKWLLPVLYIYRPLKGIFTHPKGILREIKNVINYISPDKRL